VRLSGRGIHTARTTVQQARRVLLPVRAKGFKERRLQRNGEVRVTAKVTSLPPAGRKEVTHARIHLRLR